MSRGAAAAFVTGVTMLGPVATPAMASTRDEPASASTATDPEALRQWTRRRRGLIAGVSVSAGLTAVGALTLGLPFATMRCEEGEFCDGTPLLTPVAIGAVLMVGGGIATVVTASLLGHHDRWHRPNVGAHAPSDAARARERTRGLKIGVGVSAGTMGLGAIAFGAGFGAAAACPEADDACGRRGALSGVTVGSTLLIGGALATLATAILLGSHRAHRHDRVRVQPAAHGLVVRF